MSTAGAVRRLPVAAFAALAVMSVVAFFLVQYLKTAKPLVWGNPAPVPAVFDPVGGRICKDSEGARIDYRETYLPISLASEADSVGVYIFSSAQGPPVAILSTGTPLQTSQPTEFAWNGHRTGGALAPPGTYFFEVVLQHQGRTLSFSDKPVRLITSAHPPDHGCLAAVK